MTKQCPSCGGDCGRTAITGCRYTGRARNLLTSSELNDIHGAMSRWGSNTVEACVELYLLGINRRRKAMFDFTHEQSETLNKAVSMWATENTPDREKAAFKYGYHAAMQALTDSQLNEAQPPSAPVAEQKSKIFADWHSAYQSWYFEETQTSLRVYSRQAVTGLENGFHAGWQAHATLTSDIERHLNAELLKENEALRLDAERYREIRSGYAAGKVIELRKHRYAFKFGFTNYEYETFKTLDETIDAAILATKGG